MRIAVISPFVDKRHGTERAVAELVERLAAQHGDEIDLYTQSVADLGGPNLGEHRGEARGRIELHRVARFPGPQIVRFPAWLFLNRQARRRSRRANRATADVVFSPGINALDADVILVHAVFHRLAELQRARSRSRLRGMHRNLYYSLLCRLERQIYSDSRVTLAAVSKHTAAQLARYFGRQDVTVVPNGVDAEHFSPEAAAFLRAGSRERWHCVPEHFALLLVGNDWRNKGLHALLEALASLRELPLRVLVVGQDERTSFRTQATTLGIRERIEFCEPENDVRKFYAAADLLVAPSLEDSFNLPVLEAMACGLPCIVSRNAGVSEWLTHGFDALLLRDPENTAELAEAIRMVASGTQLRWTLADNAVVTAKKFSWEEHTAQLRALLEAAAKRKKNGKQTAAAVNS